MHKKDFFMLSTLEIQSQIKDISDNVTSIYDVAPSASSGTKF